MGKSIYIIVWYLWYKKEGKQELHISVFLSKKVLEGTNRYIAAFLQGAGEEVKE